MQTLFTTDMPATRFLRNTLVFSLLGLIPTLVLYIALIPGLGPMLLQGGLPLSRFLRQVLTNGLPVVFAVNYVGFFLYARATARAHSDRALATVLILDIPARLAVFAGLHVIVYVLSADWFGSFGGNPATALRVVAPTLARAALFENLSGVYLYATLASALPLYAALFRRSRWIGGLRGPFPDRVVALLLALVWFALSVFVLTALAAAITRAQGA
jgi:hypothetical protein